MESITLHAHYYRNKWQRYCTMYHSAAIGGQIELLRELNLTPYDLLEPDIDGNRLLHWLAANPNLTLVKFLSEIVFQIKTNLSIRLSVDETGSNADTDAVLTPAQEAAAALVSHDVLTKLPILHSGWMKKSSSILGIKTFKRRYCVLTEESFILYRSANKGPAGYINIEGCIIERLNNTEPLISILRPDVNPNAKKSMFSSASAHGFYLMKVDNETIAQEWLTALKLAAGVRPFRSSPVKYLNLNVRTQWVRILSKFGRTALHELARQKTSTDETIQVAAWLVEYGCDIQLKDKDGRTAFDYACEAGNDRMTHFLSDRQISIDYNTTTPTTANPTNNTTNTNNNRRRITMSVLDREMLDSDVTEGGSKEYLQQKLKFKGFSYLQIHFESFRFFDNKYVYTICIILLLCMYVKLFYACSSNWRVCFVGLIF